MTAYSEATHTLLNKLTSIKHRHNTLIAQLISFLLLHFLWMICVENQYPKHMSIMMVKILETQLFNVIDSNRHTLVVCAEVTSPVYLDPCASLSVLLVTHSVGPHLCQVHHRAGKCWHCSTIRLVPRHNDI